MDRLQIIQSLINKIDCQKYLEIGVWSGIVFDNIRCAYKVGVDPDVNSRATIFKTSDDFFKSNIEKFDVIFIDGLHHADQVLKDINNSLQCLNNNGYIICHDLDPPCEIMQRVPRETGGWNGDCWKAWVTIRSQRSDLSMCVVDADFGCGIITKGQQELLELKEELTWDNLVLNRSKWLNLISVDEFKQRYI